MGRKIFRDNQKISFSFLEKRSGMTFSEVIVVITILGILILLAALSLRPRYQIAKARDSKRKADLKTLSIALEDYLGDNPCYPTESEINNCNPGTGLKPYMNKIPCDPQSGIPYVYRRFECNQYAIYATLEVEEDIVEYGVGNYAVSSPNLRVIPTVMVTPTQILEPTQPPEEPTSTPQPTPDGSGYYGCKSGVCVQLLGPECSPNYQGYPNCDPGGVNLCGTPENPKNECH